MTIQKTPSFARQTHMRIAHDRDCVSELPFARCSTTKDSFKDPNCKAALTPYHPNAIRNRLPVEFKDSAIPGIRFCYPRNNHTYE